MNMYIQRENRQLTAKNGGKNMKKLKRMLFVLTALVLCVSCMAFAASADSDVMASGTCGEGLTWELTTDGTLLVTGTGAIPDYYGNENAPWYSYWSYIADIVVDDGVTEIGAYAFYYTNVENVLVGDTVTRVGDGAFCYTNLNVVYFTGDAPAFDSNAFYGAYPTVVYPGNNPTWTSDVLQNYGGSVYWLASIAPEAPVVSIARNEAGQIQLSWEAVTDAAAYQVHRRAADTDVYELMATITELTYVDTTAQMGVEYYYYVIAVSNSLGFSEPSNEVSSTLNLSAPVVTASNVASSGKIKLTWDPVDGAVEYKVYRSSSKNGTYKLVRTTGDTTYTESSGEEGQRYYYKVKAISGTSGADSDYSAVVSRVRDLPRPTVTISNVASSGKIKLTWEEVEGAVEYKVYRADSKNGDYKLMKTTDGTTYTNSSAVAGNAYYYKVVAVAENTDANSAASAVVSRTCDLARPTVTAGNDADSGKVTLKWKKVDGAVKYKVYRATSKNGEYKLMKTTTETTYTNSSASAGNRYYYKVVAVAENTAANSAASSIVSRLCDCARPELELSSSSTSSIKIKWDKVSGANGYIVYRATSKDGTYKKLTTTTSRSYTDKSVSAGKTYYYKVVAKNSNSDANSKASEILTAKATVMAPTMDTRVDATKSTIEISWDKVSGADGYYVYRRASTSDSWERIKTITSGSTTSFKDTSRSGRYYYCVAAYKTVNGTKYVSLKSEAIRARTLRAPSGVDAQALDDTFQNRVTWNSVTGATGYQIYYKTEDGSWTRAATVGDVTSYVHDVTHGVYYYYKVRPIYENNGVTTYGPFEDDEYGIIHYYLPNVNTFMSSSTNTSTSVAVIYVENNGVAPIYFYSEDGKWIDKDYYSYDRDIVLYDYYYYNYYNTLVETDCVVIQPGESTWLLVGASSSTWYDRYTRIRLTMYYDGIYYTTYTSSYYGFHYYEWD